MGFFDLEGSLSKTKSKLSKTKYIQTTNIKSKTSQDTLSKTDRSADIAALVSGIAKQASPRYREAMDKVKADPLSFRRERMLNRLRSQMSLQRFIEVQAAVSQMHHLDLMQWLDRMEQHGNR